MKQHFKLLTLAVALVAGLTTMTSCLNGDSDSSGYASPVVKVYTTYLGMGVCSTLMIQNRQTLRLLTMAFPV